jgi:hypothetical protein
MNETRVVPADEVATIRADTTNTDMPQGILKRTPKYLAISDWKQFI